MNSALRKTMPQSGTLCRYVLFVFPTHFMGPRSDAGFARHPNDNLKLHPAPLSLRFCPERELRKKVRHMGGQKGATLRGRAMPAQNAPLWDHTYVSSSCGLRWGCFGRSQGGREICRGQGDSSIADCLSRPNSTTGLHYGITGVCHQAANWILGPAGILVKAARGYAISVFSYGTYGKNRQHPSLSPCYAPTGSIDQRLDFGTTGADGTYLASRIDPNDWFGGARPASSETDAVIDIHHPARIAELQALIDDAPGVRLDPAIFEQLLMIRGRLWDEQERLSRLLEERTIDPDEFLTRMGRANQAAMVRSRQVLGSDFHRIFGDTGDDPEGLIDRDVFLDHHA